VIGMRAPIGQYPIRELRPIREQRISLGDFINSHDVYRLSEGNVDAGVSDRQAKIYRQAICSPHRWKKRIARINKVPRFALDDSEHLTPDLRRFGLTPSV
jgi:hypothetical protein